MTRALVLYDSQYGNTKMVAETIAEGIETKGMQADVRHMKEVDPMDVPGYDVIAIGTPNHLGGPTGRAKKLVKSLKAKDLERKTFGFFDTCLKGEEGKATRKLANKLRDIAPGVMIAPELSILIGGMKGPIVDGELPKCAEFVGGLISSG
ncbi:MAG: flavodoxin family protein [Thermoplasmata archaeon]